MGKIYEAPVQLISRKVIIVYHPQDLQRIEVFHNDKSYGFLQPLNPHINCMIKRRQQITEIVSQEDSPAETPPAYQAGSRRLSGGKLFDKEDQADEL